MPETVDLDSAHRPFDNIINFRDVGASVNSLAGSRILKEGVLFRSARLDDASERDKRRILNELHISTVIDLRSSTEHQMALEKQSRQSDADSLDLTLTGRVKRVLISLTGKSFERALCWRLSWYNYLKVIGLVTWGYRSDAVNIVCSQVMRPRGLIGLAEDTLDYSQGEMKQVFDVLVHGETYPALVHCTQGKDRTGLVILLVLLSAGVSGEVISGDYSKSEAELVVEFEERMKEIRALGLDEEYTKCPDGFTGAVQEHLERKYGGVEGYLKSLGVERESLVRLRERLMV